MSWNRVGAMIAFMCVSLVFTPRLHAVSPTTAPSSDASAWYRQILVDGYEKNGHKMPAWDESARAVARELAVLWSRSDPKSGDEYDSLWNDGKAALAAQCDDPMVLYAAARDRDFFTRPWAEWFPLHYQAAERIIDTNYHPYLKCLAQIRAAICKAREKSTDQTKAAAQNFYNNAVEFLPLVAADPSVPREALFDLFSALRGAIALTSDDEEATFKKVLAVFEKNHSNASDVRALRAEFYLDFAWKGRGTGFADAVTEEQWKRFSERIAIAQHDAEEAWRLDPTNHQVALLMLTIGMGLSYDEKQFDEWYDCAINTNPRDTYLARTAKLNYLQPKWHGSAEKMIAFAKSCVVNPGEDDTAPLTIVQAYLTISKYTSDGIKSRAQRGLFSRYPGAWKDISPVYEAYIKQHPDVVFHRSRYAQIALWCDQPQVADEQIRAMDGKFSYGWFGTDTEFNRVKFEVTELLKDRTSQK